MDDVEKSVGVPVPTTYEKTLSCYTKPRATRPMQKHINLATNIDIQSGKGHPEENTISLVSGAVRAKASPTNHCQTSHSFALRAATHLMSMRTLLRPVQHLVFDHGNEIRHRRIRSTTRDGPRPGDSADQLSRIVVFERDFARGNAR